MLKTTRVIAALIFCAISSLTIAQTGGTAWRINRAGSPYDVQINLDGIWYNFAKLSNSGLVSFDIAAYKITRSAISTTNIPETINTIITSGYSSIGDVGKGAIYVRGTPSGTDAIQSIDGQWWNINTNIPLYTSWFGAKLDATPSGGTDDTAATVAAIAADNGHGVIINGPTRLDTITITTSNHDISCTSANGAPIFAKVSTSNPFFFNGGSTKISNINLHDCSFYSYNSGVNAQSSGSYVWAKNCFQCNFTNLNFSQGYTSLFLNGINSNYINVNEVNSLDAVSDHYLIDAGYGGIVFGGVTSNITGGPPATSGLHVYASGGLFVHDSYFIHSGNCIHFNPDSGGVIPIVAWAGFVNVHGDGCSTGIAWKINPGAGGTVSAISMTNTWSGSSISGIAISCTGGGVVDGIYTVNHRSALNQNDGVSIGCGQHIQMSGGLIGNNNLAAAAYNGISVAANVSHLSFRDIIIGMLPSSGTWTSPGATQVHAISVLAGTGDYIDFTNNDTQGGSTGTEINIIPANANGTVSSYSSNKVPGKFQISAQGSCTMAAGTCPAQSLPATYNAAPVCYASWTGTGTLNGKIKLASTTTTVTPSSSDGADTAVVNYVCLGD